MIVLGLEKVVSFSVRMLKIQRSIILILIERIRASNPHEKIDTYCPQIGTQYHYIGTYYLQEIGASSHRETDLNTESILNRITIPST